MVLLAGFPVFLAGDQAYDVLVFEVDGPVPVSVTAVLMGVFPAVSGCFQQVATGGPCLLTGIRRKDG